MAENSAVTVINSTPATGTNGAADATVETLRWLLSLPIEEQAQIRDQLTRAERGALGNLLRPATSSPGSARDRLDDDIWETDPLVLEQLADMKWLNSRDDDSFFKPYAGKYIAFAYKRVLGAGDDPKLLIELMAAEHGIPEERILFRYVEGPEEWTWR